MSLQSDAVAAAEARLRVFPLKARSKEPRMTGGFKSASADAAYVGGLWAQWPDANIGLDLPPDVVVIDVDSDDGAERVRALALPAAAAVVRTGRGWQAYYRLPEGRTLRQGPLDGIGDLKASGSGYTLLPSSVHPDGAVYKFVRGGLEGIVKATRLSDEHVDALERLRAKSPTGNAPVLPELITEGRNVMLTSLAGTMRRRGSSEAAILAALEVENVARCRPPLDRAEVEKIAASVSRYRPAHPSPLPELRVLEPVDGFALSSALGAIPDYPSDALPAAARELLERGVRDGLPAALLGGASLAALAGAVGSKARLEVTPTWHERAILWVANLAPRGAGKSPAQDHALGPIRDYDAQLGQSDDDPSPIRLGDLTLEALARNLVSTDGAGLLDVDELAVVLKGLGEYKRGGGGDRGRFLALWSGAPWGFDRVAGGTTRNKVRLRIARPTLVIIGGLQPALHELLGGEDDGLRPRWLPHLAPLPEGAGSLSGGSQVLGWQMLLGRELLPKRGTERQWTLTGSGLAAFEHYRCEWKRQAREHEAASIAAALIKADVHLARVALVLAEAHEPGAGGAVGSELIERAAMIIDFTLNSWRALPEQGALALSRRDYLLDRSMTRLIAWLEEHEGEASRRELQRAHVAGCRTADEIDALLERYEAVYPGSVTTSRQEQGGLATVIVRGPARRPVITLSPLGDTVERSEAKPLGYAESDAVDTGDSDGGDSEVGDTIECLVCATAYFAGEPGSDEAACAGCAGLARGVITEEEAEELRRRARLYVIAGSRP